MLVNPMRQTYAGSGVQSAKFFEKFSPHEPVLREMPLPIEERALSHPDPLPKGEGESLPDLERQAILVCPQTGGAVPSPQGRGPG